MPSDVTQRNCCASATAGAAARLTASGDPMALDMRDLMTMPDPELLEFWRKQKPTDSGTSPEQNVLAAEIDRRGLDL